MLDVVYNHAGGFEGDDEGLYFWDRQADPGNNDNSLYFIDRGMAGGLSFALWKHEVRQFLIDNASFWLGEYHVDGFRYDEVSALLANNETAGWGFCQDLTGTARFIKSRALQNAEYWPSEYGAAVTSIVAPTGQGGAGFDVVQHDALRNAVRAAVAAASGGAGSAVDMGAIGESLSAQGLPYAWSVVPCVENHDVVLAGAAAANSAAGGPLRFAVVLRAEPVEGRHGPPARRARHPAALHGPGVSGGQTLGHRSGRRQSAVLGGSRRRTKPWPISCASRRTSSGCAGKSQPSAGRASTSFTFTTRTASSRSIAGFEGVGRDVVVVASFNDAPFFEYALGFPSGGRWVELLNSDVYDNWVNPLAVGNGGAVAAAGGPLHGLPSSAAITIPPRAILVFGVS